MEVRLAEHSGMCFGVRDAIDLALDLARRRPLTILGDLVHNPDVLADLDAAGAARAGLVNEVKTRSLLVTAHGTSDRVRRELHAQGFEVHDATCPLVKRAHLALLRLVRQGRYPVIIGQASHVEVRGLVGDLDAYTVILKTADIEQLAGRPRLGIVAQTTQPIELVLDLVAAVRGRFSEVDVRFIDTVCQPTKDRQLAVRRLAAETDLVVVVGGPDSNNSRKLTELARTLGRPAYQVAGAGDLRAEWFAGVRVVGLTAGTSTPDRTIAEVQAWLQALPGDSEPASVSLSRAS